MTDAHLAHSFRAIQKDLSLAFQAVPDATYVTDVLTALEREVNKRGLNVDVVRAQDLAGKRAYERFGYADAYADPLICRNCRLHKDAHRGDRCLFEPTTHVPTKAGWFMLPEEERIKWRERAEEGVL